MIKKQILLFLFTAILLKANAQKFSQDSTFTQPAAKVMKLYSEKLAEKSPLYQGREYIEFDNRISGHAFSSSKQFSPASILYDEIVYENVPLLFDIVKDEVVVLHPNGFVKVKLLNERISYFSFAGHTFIRLDERAPSGRFAPETGFYEILHKGQFLVLAKRTKKLISTNSSDKMALEFINDDHFYIKKEGVYHTVRSKRSLLKLLKGRKKEIRRFLSKN